jgi:hypothetical protein
MHWQRTALTLLTMAFIVMLIVLGNPWLLTSY